jgi:alkylation response protein AidB-like acyl-CoA dehydrogenase
MDFSLNEEQKLLQKTVRDYVEENIGPRARELDEQGHGSRETMTELMGLGVGGVFIPEEYNGVGMGFLERALVLEEISRHSAGLGIALMTHHLACAALVDFGNEEQKQKYLPGFATGELIGGLAITEPGGGSDIANHKTIAVKEGDKWRLNGRKCFITNSHLADVVIVTAKIGTDEKGRTQLSAFIIPADTPGISPGREENKLGLRGSSTGDVILNDCVVGEEALLGEEGKGLRVALKTISETGRSGMAAIALGILRGCLEEGTKFAKERELYGKPLANLQAIQFNLAETKVEYESARLLLHSALTLKDQGVRCDVEIAMAKYYATEAAVRAAKRTIDLMGGYGIIEDYPVGRFLRDAVSSIPAGGTSEIMKIIIANSLVR